MTSWYAFFGPSALPKDLAARIHADIGRIAAQPEFQERLLREGAEHEAMTPRALRAIHASRIHALGESHTRARHSSAVMPRAPALRDRTRAELFAGTLTCGSSTMPREEAGSCRNGRRPLRFSGAIGNRLDRRVVLKPYQSGTAGESDHSPAIPPPGRGSGACRNVEPCSARPGPTRISGSSIVMVPPPRPRDGVISRFRSNAQLHPLRSADRSMGSPA